MILRVPSYYRDFKCKGGVCSDNCCIGWEIDIDSKTADIYSTVGGDIGKKLKENISTDGVPHFIMNNEERCPFLNEKNLCEIFIELGQDKLCQICSDHPRYYSWYDGIKEAGVGLGCESAAELILTQDRPFSYYDTEIYPEKCDDYDDGAFDYLCSVRKKIIRHLERTDTPMSDRLSDVLFYAMEAQERYDNFDLTISEITKCPHKRQSPCGDIFKFLSGLELMEKDNFFKEICPYLNDLIELSDAFYAEYPNALQYLQNCAVYFVWRHLLKSVFDEEFYSAAAFAVMSTEVLSGLFLLSYSKKGCFSLEEAVRACVYYSKEIEYSEENMNKIFDAFYNDENFSAYKLLNLSYII